MAGLSAFLCTVELGYNELSASGTTMMFAVVLKRYKREAKKQQISVKIIILKVQLESYFTN